MPDHFHIEIEGNPVPQARMRIFRRGKMNICYDPNGKEKTRIKEHFKNYLPEGFSLFKNPSIGFVFYMTIPKSMPKHEKSLAQEGLLKHIKKPDIDNLMKLYFDCLSKIVIQDDSTASIAYAIKLYHPEPKTVIQISETKAYISEQIEHAFLYSQEFCRSKHATIASRRDLEDYFRLNSVLFGVKNSLDPLILS